MSGKKKKKKKKKTVLPKSSSGKAVSRTRKSGRKMGIT